MVAELVIDPAVAPEDAEGQVRHAVGEHSTRLHDVKIPVGIHDSVVDELGDQEDGQECGPSAEKLAGPVFGGLH